LLSKNLVIAYWLEPDLSFKDAMASEIICVTEMWK
jgi:hypothetical protein